MAEKQLEKRELIEVSAREIIIKIKNKEDVIYDKILVADHIDIYFWGFLQKNAKGKIDIKCRIKITNSLITSAVMFDNAIFHKNVDFTGTTFTNAHFQATNFNDVDFSGTTFNWALF